MPIDPSIYAQSGRVNLGSGLSDILDQQRQRDAQRMQQENSLASLAMQREQMQQKQSRQGSQDLNMMLSNRVQSGEPIETVMQWAIEEGKKVGVSPDITQRHVTNVYSAATPQARSDVAFTQAYPELVAEQRAKAIYVPQKPERTRTVAVIGDNGKPTLVAEADAVGMTPYKPESAGTGIAQQRLELERQKFEHAKTNPAGSNKPLPTAALKLQQDELDAIGTATGLNKDLASFQNMIESGELPLGPVANLEYKARNLAGNSTKESRNYSSFKASLEGLRNASLRLNKGVQTDGDAVRAWNELFENINDGALVSQRLKEIQKLNERAVQLRKMNVDVIRSNYGKESLDVSGRESVTSAYESDDAEAVAWAKANPNDPRSAQIMSLHGR